MIAGYKKFLGNKKYKWHQPTRKFWIQGSLNVVINPEIALEWDGKKYFIKLYLKSEKPSKDRFSSILALMKTCLGNKDFNYGLLDVRSSKLYLFEENMLLQIPLIEGEARSLEFILEKL
jgi:hypothetical protein